jgi:hypothetical protein
MADGMIDKIGEVFHRQNKSPMANVWIDDIGEVFG